MLIETLWIKRRCRISKKLATRTVGRTFKDLQGTSSSRFTGPLGFLDRLRGLRHACHLLHENCVLSVLDRLRRRRHQARVAGKEQIGGAL